MGLGKTCTHIGQGVGQLRPDVCGSADRCRPTLVRGRASLHMPAKIGASSAALGGWFDVGVWTSSRLQFAHPCTPCRPRPLPPPPRSLLSDKCGTPAFMAPEQHLIPQRSKGYGLQVDVWAVGVSMYMLMFGGHPLCGGGGGGGGGGSSRGWAQFDGDGSDVSRDLLLG